VQPESAPGAIAKGDNQVSDPGRKRRKNAEGRKNGIAVLIPAIGAISTILAIVTIPTIVVIFANAAILTNVAGVRFERQRRSLLQTG
jgi:hypothetical protein